MPCGLTRGPQWGENHQGVYMNMVRTVPELITTTALVPLNISPLCYKRQERERKKAERKLTL